MACPSRSAHLLAAIGLVVLLAPAAVAAQEGTITYTHVVKREMPAFGGGSAGVSRVSVAGSRSLRRPAPAR